MKPRVQRGPEGHWGIGALEHWGGIGEGQSDIPSRVHRVHPSLPRQSRSRLLLLCRAYTFYSCSRPRLLVPLLPPPCTTVISLPVLFPSDESVEPPCCPSPNRLDILLHTGHVSFCKSKSHPVSLSPCLHNCTMSLRLYHVALRPASVLFSSSIAGPVAGQAPGPGTQGRPSHPVVMHPSNDMARSSYVNDISKLLTEIPHVPFQIPESCLAARPSARKLH